MPALQKFENPIYAALRIVAGFMLTFHGIQKVIGWLSDKPRMPVGSQLWIGGIIELVAGALICVGLFTRPAAFIASGLLAVAYFQFHFAGDFSHWHWLPAVNGGDAAVLYCFVFLFIAARGPGRASFDGGR